MYGLRYPADRAAMCTTSYLNEWDRLVNKIGLLTLTAGFLEAAAMAMHCKAAGKSEAELKSRLNEHQRQGLKKAVKSLDWPDDKKNCPWETSCRNCRAGQKTQCFDPRRRWNRKQQFDPWNTRWQRNQFSYIWDRCH
jgi:hypothetical protein